MVRFKGVSLSDIHFQQWLKKHPTVIAAHLGHVVFGLMQLITIFISIHPQYCLQPSELESLLNGGVQMLAGLYSVTMTSYVFFLGRMDALVQADWTVDDVVVFLKKKFVHMIYVISAIFLFSLLLCGLSVYLQSDAIQVPLYVNLLVFNESLLFIGTAVGVIVYYIINIVDSDNLRRAADDLRKSIESKGAKEGNPALFFEQFNLLVTQCRTLLPEEMRKTPLEMKQLVYLQHTGLLTREMLERVNEIRRYHSCVLHGSETGVNQAACDQVTELRKQLSAICQQL